MARASHPRFAQTLCKLRIARDVRHARRMRSPGDRQSAPDNPCAQCRSDTDKRGEANGRCAPSRVPQPACLYTCRRPACARADKANIVRMAIIEASMLCAWRSRDARASLRETGANDLHSKQRRRKNEHASMRRRKNESRPLRVPQRRKSATHRHWRWICCLAHITVRSAHHADGLHDA